MAFMNVTETIEGMEAGTDLSAAQFLGMTTTAAAATLSSAGAGTYDFTAGSGLPSNLAVVVNGQSQSVTFVTADFVADNAATRAEVAARITADLVGAFGTDATTTTDITNVPDVGISSIQVTGGSANLVMLFPTVAVVGVARNAVGVATSPTGAILGLLQNTPDVGEAASVAVSGRSKVVAGAAVAIGAQLTVDGTGRAVTASTDDVTFGRALVAAGSAGEVITCNLDESKAQ